MNGHWQLPSSSLEKPFTPEKGHNDDDATYQVHPTDYRLIARKILVNSCRDKYWSKCRTESSKITKVSRGFQYRFVNKIYFGSNFEQKRALQDNQVPASISRLFVLPIQTKTESRTKNTGCPLKVFVNKSWVSTIDGAIEYILKIIQSMKSRAFFPALQVELWRHSLLFQAKSLC